MFRACIISIIAAPTLLSCSSDKIEFTNEQMRIALGKRLDEKYLPGAYSIESVRNTDCRKAKFGNEEKIFCYIDINVKSDGISAEIRDTVGLSMDASHSIIYYRELAIQKIAFISAIKEIPEVAHIDVKSAEKYCYSASECSIEAVYDDLPHEKDVKSYIKGTFELKDGRLKTILYISDITDVKWHKGDYKSGEYTMKFLANKSIDISPIPDREHAPLGYQWGVRGNYINIYSKPGKYNRVMPSGISVMAEKGVGQTFECAYKQSFSIRLQLYGCKYVRDGYSIPSDESNLIKRFEGVFHG